MPTDGREVELERLYREEGARIWRALVAHTGDREIAADAVAEAFAQALHRGDEVKAPGPWLWRAAFRIAMGELGIDGQVSTALIDAMNDGSASTIQLPVSAFS